MKPKLKNVLLGILIMTGTVITTDLMAQSSCSPGKEGNVAACAKGQKAGVASTSGCSPSGCRGAKTKFGEAKIISTLRLDLIALKADMEKSSEPAFSSRSYDIHDIIGETDEESLAIIVREVKLIETAFTEKLNHQFTAFTLPKSKAKQVRYLSVRIQDLQKLL
ncbi:hypothetical protein QQ020_12970 [Fulvivirgaceae bacterium BMA12]|uniref:Secreted protein n=1 Tax=Agaribacillus aureus TaxID=3051825 RepID=A0ABT8L6Y1_9BACT|nr:hypothetical protein [Fulvivirgaceae bacterium BMA12]